MKAYIVRHAQTGENAAGKYQGQRSDIGLDEAGLWQARQLGLRLAPVRFDCGYTSDQMRALSTAAQIVLGRVRGLRFIAAPQLRERNLGAYEGTRIADGQYGRDMAASGMSFADFRPPGGGESWAQLQNRVVSYFRTIARHHHRDTVLIISHGSAITALLVHLLGKELTRENQLLHKVDNASLSIVRWDAQYGQGCAESINSIDHLR